jgi:hypothetical protein
MGGSTDRFVNREALARQRADLARGWMLVGEWLGSHPPLSRRLAALAAQPAPAPAGAGRWLRPAFAVGVMLFIGLVSLSFRSRHFARAAIRPPQKVDSAAASAKVHRDLVSLRSVIEADLRAGRLVPWDVYDVYERWEVHKDDIGPIDPFSGYWYEYDQRGGVYRLWSVGPDG